MSDTHSFINFKNMSSLHMALSFNGELITLIFWRSLEVANFSRRTKASKFSYCSLQNAFEWLIEVACLLIPGNLRQVKTMFIWLKYNNAKRNSNSDDIIIRPWIVFHYIFLLFMWYIHRQRLHQNILFLSKMSPHDYLLKIFLRIF